MRITETQLRQIIRQEVSRAVLSESFKFPSSYPKSWRAPGWHIGYDTQAELAIAAGVPMAGSPESNRIWDAGGKELDMLLKKTEDYGNAKNRKSQEAYAKWKATQPPEPEPPPAPDRPKGALKFPPGVSRSNKSVIKHVLDTYYEAGDAEHAAEELRYNTLVFEPDYEPEGDPHEDVFHSTGDRADEVVKIMRGVDKTAAAAITKALKTVQV